MIDGFSRFLFEKSGTVFPFVLNRIEKEGERQ